MTLYCHVDFAMLSAGLRQDKKQVYGGISTKMVTSSVYFYSSKLLSEHYVPITIEFARKFSVEDMGSEIWVEGMYYGYPSLIN